MKLIENSKITKFLQGNNPNVVGTILGFTRKVNANYMVKSVTYQYVNKHPAVFDSFRMYFYHSTAKVTRYLVNTLKMKRILKKKIKMFHFYFFFISTR